METALLRINENDIAENMLVVFGEDPLKVKKSLEKKGYAVNDVSHSREFHTFYAKSKSDEFPFIVAGLGSASVECVLSELAMLNGQSNPGSSINLVLGGTCGASPNHYKIGDAVPIAEGLVNNSGSYSFYSSGRKKVFRPSSDLFTLTTKLFSELEGREPKGHRMTSSDAFYGFGCLLDGTKPFYSGAKLEGGQMPAGFVNFERLYQSRKPYLIDMETAFFYAFCNRLSGLKGVAIKGVSNYVPFDPSNYIGDEDKALNSSLDKCVKVISYLNKR
jgi:uridine phosphorylase